MSSRNWTDQQLIETVPRQTSIAGVLRELGLTPAGGNYKGIQIHLERLELDTTHFTGQSWSKGKSVGVSWNKIPLQDILVENSTYTNTSTLKKRLVAAGLLKDLCCICGLLDWMGTPISLQLDHINGRNRDNRIENLRILCPNCHSQTPTHGSKNRKFKGK